MKILRKLVFGILVSFFCGTASADTIPWANFGGFYAGMKKADAKKAGYTNCDYGKGLGETSDSIYCDIPKDKWRLGSLRVSSARIEFKQSRLDRVHKIHLKLEGQQEEVLGALKTQYGEILDGGRRLYVWQRETGHAIEVSKRESYGYPISVTFTYDPKLAVAIKKHKESEKNKANVLDSF